MVFLWTPFLPDYSILFFKPQLKCHLLYDQIDLPGQNGSPLIYLKFYLSVQLQSYKEDRPGVPGQRFSKYRDQRFEKHCLTIRGKDKNLTLRIHMESVFENQIYPIPYLNSEDSTLTFKSEIYGSFLEGLSCLLLKR